MQVSSDYNGCVEFSEKVALNCTVTDFLNSTAQWIFNGKSATSNCHIYEGFKDVLDFSRCDIYEEIFNFFIKSFDGDKIGRWSCIHRVESKSIVFDDNNVCCECYLYT